MRSEMADKNGKRGSGNGSLGLPERASKGIAADDLVHVFWLSGMSCDGCSIALAAANHPSMEQLQWGTVPGMPKVVLHHPMFSEDAGDAFLEPYRQAVAGTLGSPYMIVLEGSVPDDEALPTSDGFFSSMGSGGFGATASGDGANRVTEWLYRLAPGAMASMAIGTCATWGGIPAAAGNPTNSMGVMDYLGKDYRGTAGLPVINIPGCAPIGDNFTETVGMILLFLQGLGPLPEFDELGRPAWLFKETVHQQCVRGGYYEEGTFAEKYGDKECLVEVGCWGPVVQCNITKRGAINHMGGCMNTGGICIGCTMPGFPDKFAPFYSIPPGSTISSNTTRTYGAVIRRLRRMTMRYQNMEPRWSETGHVPSSWGAFSKPSLASRAIHYLYEKIQFSDSVRPGDHVGKGSLKAKGIHTPEI